MHVWVEVCVWAGVSGGRTVSVCVCERVPVCACECMHLAESNLGCCFTGIICLFSEPGSNSVASDSQGTFHAYFLSTGITGVW